MYLKENSHALEVLILKLLERSSYWTRSSSSLLGG
jgi:hypothetical protein